jgi:hypothetical protein
MADVWHPDTCGCGPIQFKGPLTDCIAVSFENKCAIHAKLSGNEALAACLADNKRANRVKNALIDLHSSAVNDDIEKLKVSVKGTTLEEFFKNTDSLKDAVLASIPIEFAFDKFRNLSVSAPTIDQEHKAAIAEMFKNDSVTVI